MRLSGSKAASEEHAAVIAKALPDHHIDGVPYCTVCVGVDEHGRRVYESVEFKIPPGMPSYLWREGC